MTHLSDEQVNRYAARALAGRDRLAISDHLASCPVCRQRLARSKAVQLRASTTLAELTGTSPGALRPRHRLAARSGRLARSLTNLAYRLIRAGGPRRGNQSPEPGRAGWQLAFRPAAALAAGTLCAGILVLIIVFAGRHEPQDWLPTDSVAGRPIALEDHGRLIRIGQDGTLAGLAGPAKAEQVEPVRRVLVAALDDRPLPVSPDLQKLRAGPNPKVALGPGLTDPSDSLSKAFGPAQSLVADACPQFRWPAVPGASGYVLHIVEDGANQEVYRSGTIAGADATSGSMQWTLLDQGRLSAGVVYRWHVTAMTAGGPKNLPDPNDPKTRFAVLPAQQANALAEAKKSWDTSALATAVLDLNAGLLDEAETGFRRLRDDRSQTSQGRALLDRLIASVQRLRVNDLEKNEQNPPGRSE
ncbi:MAG: hypothetical protein JO069_00165 [Verrucomicrobia bacterium]|nr:hypothetical protein [Verrucomicrobiota bacterium]